MIGADEYDVFTAICRQTDLFLFNSPGVVFLDETRPDIMTSRISPNELTAERLSGQFKYRCIKHREILDDFNNKNAKRWPLAPQFECPGGYALVSEGNTNDQQARPLALARVGFSADRSLALAYVEYVAACAYYLLFERSSESGDWARADCCMAWVT